MQTIPLSLGAAAAVPFAQRQSAADQTEHAAAGQARQTSADKQAENAAGIGQTDNDQPASDRDADGRRIWEKSPAKKIRDEETAASVSATAKDPTGDSGSRLDLTG